MMSALWPGLSSEMSVAPLSMQPISCSARRLHFRDDRGAREGCARVSDDGRAGGFIGAVAEPGPQTGALLNHHFQLQLLDQSGDAIWCKRDSLLARSGFRWDADSH